MRKMEFNVSNKIARLQMIPRTTEENEQAEEETQDGLLQTRETETGRYKHNGKISCQSEGKERDDATDQRRFRIDEKKDTGWAG